MYLGVTYVGNAHASYTLYVYRCDHCTATYEYDVPQRAPFRCHSPACNWSMIRVQEPKETSPCTP